MKLFTFEEENTKNEQIFTKICDIDYLDCINCLYFDDKNNKCNIKKDED